MREGGAWRCGSTSLPHTSSHSSTGQLAVPLANAQGKAGSLSLMCSSQAALRATPGVHTVSNPIRALLKQVVCWVFLGFFSGVTEFRLNGFAVIRQLEKLFALCSLQPEVQQETSTEVLVNPTAAVTFPCEEGTVAGGISEKCKNTGTVH